MEKEDNTQPDHSTSQLELLCAIGMGKIHGGLLFHPDRTHLLFPIGSQIMVKNVTKHSFFFLTGHTNSISSLSVSHNGKYVASGQITHVGFKTNLFIWDFETREKICEHKLHKEKVQDIAFSPNDIYLASVGGPDDGTVVLFSVKHRAPLMAAVASSGLAGLPNVVKFLNNNDCVFATAGMETLRIWDYDPKNRLAHPYNAQLGYTKRNIISMAVDHEDNHLYCGTETGDILKLKINVIPSIGEPGTTEYTLVLASTLSRLICKTKQKSTVPECVSKSACFNQGVTALALLKNGEILVGSGDGTVSRTIEKEVVCQAASFSKLFGGDRTQHDLRLSVLKSFNVKNKIDSIALRGEGHQMYIGTNAGEIYSCNLLDFTHDLIYTCHTGPVKDVIFPSKTSELFASCGDSIRIWNTKTGMELLRIVVPNLICFNIRFYRDGKGIISGWNDGKIRAFTPETGKVIFTIHDAHKKEITGLEVTSDCQRIISADGLGIIRAWEICTNTQRLLATMQEHRGAVTHLCIRSDNQQLISTGMDGTCRVWNLKTYRSEIVMYSGTVLLWVSYHPSECQVLTAGVDRKITYWEIYTGQPIRILEGTINAAVNSLDVSSDGNYFASAGNDRLLTVWKYHEGEPIYFSDPTTADINVVRYCPFNELIVTGGEDGALFVWQIPSGTVALQQPSDPCPNSDEA